MLYLQENSSAKEEDVLPPLRVVEDQPSAPKVSAREYNNEFVYDVLDFLMRTNCQLSAVKQMKKLIKKWTSMSLPTIDAIRRNHMPRYLERNPEIAKRLEQGNFAFTSLKYCWNKIKVLLVNNCFL